MRRKTIFCQIVLLFIASLSPALGFGAAEPSPVGLWKTIDDNSGHPRGLIRIKEVNGRLEGTVDPFLA